MRRIAGISGSKITDASLPKLLHLGPKYISLVDTKVTAKALLNDRSPGTRDLIVGEGHFTATELKALTKAGFSTREDVEWLK